MPDLASKHCVPCKGGVPPLQGENLRKLALQLPAWQVKEEHHIVRTYEFPDFKKALAFTNKVGDLAEHEGHHPDILLRWGAVTITIWTHKIDGLTESDFILAAKVDMLPR